MTERTPRRDNTPAENAAQLVGNDAAWRFGSGRVHAGLQIPGKTTNAVTALMTVPAGFRALNATAPGASAGRAIWPVLWKPAFENSAQRQVIPLVLQTPKTDDAAPVPSLSDLQAAAQALLSGSFGVEFKFIPAVPPGFSIQMGGPAPAPTLTPPDQFLTDPPWRPDPAIPAPVAVVAVIDDGLPFAHRALRAADGQRTRMEFCWLQGATPPTGGSAVPKGREYLRADIDDLILRYGDDEDLLYSRSGALEPHYPYGSSVSEFATHGAHTLCAAARAPDKNGDRLRIIGVQLAPQVTLDTSGAEQKFGVLQAMHYVFERADRIEAGYGGAPMPLIINLSYGYTGGPHDGTDLVTAAIHDLVRQRTALGKPTILVLPSGNTFSASLCGQITKKAFAAGGGKFSVPWRIQPSDRTMSTLQFWFAANADLHDLSLTVVDPDAHVALSLKGADFADPTIQYPVVDADEAIVGRLDSEFAGARRCISIRLAPTETEAGAEPHTRAGLWRVVLSTPDAGALQGPVDCRILRDVNPVGYFQGALQSRLDSGEPLFNADGTWRNHDHANEFLRRFGTLNDLATGDCAIVVAGTYPDGRPAYYSSAALAGVSALSPRVHCATISESDHVLAGQPGAGTRSGAKVRLSGTSTAAPRVTNAIACALLERHIKISAGQTVIDWNSVAASDKLGPVPVAEIPGVTRTNATGQRLARIGDFMLAD